MFLKNLPSTSWATAKTKKLRETDSAKILLLFNPLKIRLSLLLKGIYRNLRTVASSLFELRKELL